MFCQEIKRSVYQSYDWESPKNSWQNIYIFNRKKVTIMAEENNEIGTPLEFLSSLKEETPDNSVPDKVYVDSEEEKEILMSVIEMLQTIGRKMDERLKEDSTSDEDYKSKTRVSELLKTRFGKDYLIVTTLLGMIIKNPKQANMIASILISAEAFEEFLHTIDVVYDENKGVIDLMLLDGVDKVSTIITDLT